MINEIPFPAGRSNPQTQTPSPSIATDGENNSVSVGGTNGDTSTYNGTIKLKFDPIDINTPEPVILYGGNVENDVDNDINNDVDNDVIVDQDTSKINYWISLLPDGTGEGNKTVEHQFHLDKDIEYLVYIKHNKYVQLDNETITFTDLNDELLNIMVIMVDSDANLVLNNNTISFNNNKQSYENKDSKVNFKLKSFITGVYKLSVFTTHDDILLVDDINIAIVNPITNTEIIINRI